VQDAAAAAAARVRAARGWLPRGVAGALARPSIDHPPPAAPGAARPPGVAPHAEGPFPVAIATGNGLWSRAAAVWGAAAPGAPERADAAAVRVARAVAAPARAPIGAFVPPLVPARGGPQPAAAPAASAPLALPGAATPTPAPPPEASTPATPVAALTQAAAPATPATDPPPPPAAGPPPHPAHATPDVDELSRRVYERVRSRLRADLLTDRERAGRLADRG
jgi:hypothetical protein